VRALAAAAVLVVAATAAPSPARSDPVRERSVPATYGQAEDPLEQARRVAHQVPFSGTVEVSWRAGGQVHSDQFEVRGGGGSVMVDGRADPVLEMPERRLARGHGDDWALLWSPAFGPATAVPDVDIKYDVVGSAEGPPVAGRTTDVVEIRDGGRVRVRLYSDQETGLLLRREQFDEAGQPERTVEFRELSLDESTPAPQVPPRATAQLARQAPSLRPATASSAPAMLGEGYVRLGVYRRGPVVHVHYSDGLFELSVFEQSGRLDDDDLPGAGQTISVGQAEARLYSWAGGHLLVWEAGPVVRTAVSDAPAGQLISAARDLPKSGSGRPSLLDKLRQAASTLVDPLR
jgi:hypothetical protein